MNKFILVMLAAISTQSLAGEFRLSFYAEKMDSKGGSYTEVAEEYYNGYKVINNDYYTIEGGYHFRVGDDYKCCEEVEYNNDLKYIALEYSDYGYSVKLSTYEDVYSERVYAVSAYKVFKLVESTSAKIGLSVDDSGSISPSVALSFDKYFVSPSIEIDKSNVAFVLSVRY